MAAARAGELEAAARDPLDLLGPVLHRVVDGSVFADAALAVVEAADKLADDEEVDALAARRAQVRVDVQRAAQPDEALLGPHLGAVELGSADRAHEHGVGLAAGCERLGRQRLPGLADRGAAEKVFLDLEVERQLRQHAGRGRGDLGADPVAGEEDDLHSGAVVTAPSDAEETSAAYLAKTPRV